MPVGCECRPSISDVGYVVVRLRNLMSSGCEGLGECTLAAFSDACQTLDLTG